MGRRTVEPDGEQPRVGSTGGPDPGTPAVWRPGVRRQPPADDQTRIRPASEADATRAQPRIEVADLTRAQPRVSAGDRTTRLGAGGRLGATAAGRTRIGADDPTRVGGPPTTTAGRTVAPVGRERQAAPPGVPPTTPGGGSGSGRGGGGRNGIRRFLPSWKLVLAVVVLGGALVIAVLLIAYARTSIPAQKPGVNAQTSIAYFADGSELARYSTTDRTNVKLEQVPLHVQHAVMAAEDRSFETNQGISPIGIVRAAWTNLRGGSLQGGSTITQQYVKNTRIETDRTFKRKIKEFFISVKIAKEVDKKTILEGYLNAIYFGRGAYGIEAASQAYFGKHVSQLSVAEGAYLAGIINGPNLYDPTDGPGPTAKATVRFNYVLDGMVAEHWLSTSDRAGTIFPKVAEPRDKELKVPQGIYLRQMVKEEAERLLGKDALAQGLRIKTTFDRRMIAQAETSVKDVLGPRKTWKSGTQAGLVSIDPQTGAVKALYAGDGKRYSNAVTQDIAQAGSTFKPFTLLAARQGDPEHDGEGAISLRSRFNGHDDQKVEGFKDPVTNFGDEDFGNIDLVDATAHSVNTVFAALNVKIGPERTLKAAIAAGIPEKTRDLLAVPSNVLGAASPHVIDMAAAYGTIAAGGVRHDPFWITSITDSAGGNRYVHAVKGVPAFAADVVADVTYAMQQVIKRGTASGNARGLGFPAAGKTGTSSDNYSAWFDGFNSKLVTAVALYRLNANGTGQEKLEGWGRYRGREVSGGSFPVLLWADFMKAVMKGVDVPDFPEPTFGGDRVGSDLDPGQGEDPSQSPDPATSGGPGDNGGQGRPEPSQGPTTDAPEPSAQPTSGDGGEGFPWPSNKPSVPSFPAHGNRPTATESASP